MTRLAVIFFTSVLLTVAVFSCSSLGRDEGQESPKKTESSLKDSSLQLQNGWSYETEITHEGSRSEGSVSRLFYRYNEVPPVFNFIMIGDKVFEYFPMKKIWDHYGYKRSMLPNRPECSIEDPVSSSELQTGWYTDQDRSYKAGTPSSWIYIEAAGMKAWCAPDRLDAFASYFSLNNISGEPGLLKTE